MRDLNSIKLLALDYSKKEHIVNEKTIDAIIWAFQQGQKDLDINDCLNKLIDHCKKEIEHQRDIQHHIGRGDGNIVKQHEYNIEQLNKIKLK